MRLGKREKVTKELTRKEINRRNNIKRLLIAAVAAVLVFIALAVALNSITNKEETGEVYQVIKDIEPGTKITETNFDSLFKLSEVQLSLIPEGYLTAEDDFKGQFINRAYKANDIITKDGITDTENKYKDAIENPISIAFTAPDLGSAVAGKIRAGDYVNIYGLKSVARLENGDTGKKEVSNLETAPEYTFKHIFISDVFNGDGTEIEIEDGSKGDEEGTSGRASTMFLVLLSEKDADRFNEMIANCEIKIAKLLYNTSDTYLDWVDDMNSDTGYQDIPVQNTAVSNNSIVNNGEMTYEQQINSSESSEEPVDFTEEDTSSDEILEENTEDTSQDNSEQDNSDATSYDQDGDGVFDGPF